MLKSPVSAGLESGERDLLICSADRYDRGTVDIEQGLVKVAKKGRGMLTPSVFRRHRSWCMSFHGGSNIRIPPRSRRHLSPLMSRYAGVEL